MLFFLFGTSYMIERFLFHRLPTTLFLHAGSTEKSTWPSEEEDDLDPTLC